MSVLHSVRRLIFGKKLDPFDPKTRKHIVLIALLAWIGLGADGLSSSCYGPEEAFLALGHHTPLALYLAGATALTVFIISMRSEEHTSELQSLMRISYAVFCLK